MSTLDGDGAAVAHSDLPPGTALEPEQSGQKTLEIDGRPYIMRSVPQCLVCQADDEDRLHIERGVLLMHNYGTIVDGLPEDSNLWVGRDGKRSPRDRMIARIQRHVSRGHSNLDSTVARAIMDAWALKAGIDLSGLEQTVISDMGLLSEIQRRGFEHMIRSGAAPNINQTLKATAMLLENREIGDTSHVEVATAAIQAFMKLLNRHLSEEQMRWIVTDMQADDQIQAVFRLAEEGAGAEG